LLGQISDGRGTLFLEPAGYIPFFSGLRTQDEVGLVDPTILEFMKHYPQNWWIEYVEQRPPTYIVQRESFDHYETDEGYQLTRSEIGWFNQHYHLVRHFTYDPSIYYKNTILRRLTHASTFDMEYLIFETKSASDECKDLP
jgi:hypothetical protein